MREMNRARTSAEARHSISPGLGIVSLVFSLILLAASCATRQALETVKTEAGTAVIDMKASDFKFEPNNLKARRGDILEFNITNVSGTTHNFTIKDPKGEVLQSADLPPHKTTTVTVTVAEAGTYHFYCDKPLHSTLGMKGWLDVVE
jgi:plastocyanin